MDSEPLHDQTKNISFKAKRSSSKNELLKDFDNSVFNEKINKKYTAYSLTLETQVQKLKISLEGWKHVLVPIYNVFIWKQQWYAGALLGGSTLLFLILWMSDLSVLTTLSGFGLIFTLADYFVPTISASMTKNATWDKTKQLQFEDICRKIILYYYRIHSTFMIFCQMRNVNSKMFYCYVIPTLLVFAWIGNSFNNLFLTYLMVTTMLMIPGMEHNGIMCKYCCKVSQKFKELMASNKLNKKEE